MSKASTTSILIFCAALAACSDGVANRTLTAPATRASSSEAPADPAAVFTPDGSSNEGLAGQDASAQMAGAQALGAQSASTNAASGNRATGHVGFPAGVLPTGTGLASERYSFTALRTDLATPDTAKGEYEVTFTTTAGGEVRIQGDVSCMNTFGNNARVAGQITKIWRNGVRSPLPASTHAYWVVVDNGEGSQVPPDQVSLMRFGNAATAQRYCATGFLSFVFPNQEGNVQVR